MPTRMGRSRLSDVEMTRMPQRARPTAAAVPSSTAKNSHEVAGTQTRGGPIIGMIEKSAAIAPQKIARGTPLTASPTPVSAPWISAMRSDPVRGGVNHGVRGVR